MNEISTVVATQGCRDRAKGQSRSRVSKRRGLLLSCALIGIVGIGDHPRAQGSGAAFHAPGDLPGGGVASNDLSFRVTDGLAMSNVAIVTVDVTPVIDAPIARAGVVTTSEGTPVSGTLQATDIDSPALSFSVATPPAGGAVTLDPATGAFTYTPNAGAIGYDPFTFNVSDGTNSSSATEMVFVVASSPRWPGQTVRASVASNAAEGNASSILGGGSSADGRFIAVNSEASNLVAGDTNGAADVFVRDRQTGQTTRVSVASDGTQGNDFSLASDLSPDGRYVAFTSLASNLVAGDTNGAPDAFVHDRQTGQTTRISVASDGTEGNGGSSYPVLSADGRYVAFYGSASNLVAGDTNGDEGGDEDVFLHDRQTGQTTLVSVSSTGAQGNSNNWRPSISADGRFIAFNSESTNLVAGDTNDEVDGFVHDRQTAQTTRVSVASDGSQGNTGGGDPRLSADGRYVAFVSDAPNLVAGDTNGVEDVFVHDRQTGQTTRVSVATAGAQGDGESTYAGLSADGRYVVIQSSASNLVAGDTNGVDDVFVHDRQTGATVRVSVASDGSQGNAASEGDNDFGSGPAISADGRWIVFPSGASNLVASDTNATEDTFVVGGVSVSPTTVNVPGAGAARSVDVVFVYPGTPWTATSADPWITVTNQSSMTGNGTVSYSVATGPARTGILLVATQPVTIRQGILGAPPTLTAIAPASGPTAGGTSVTITGTNLAAGATVALGGAAATNVVVVNATTITATTAAHAAGTVDVVVTNADTQSATLFNGFRYAAPFVVNTTLDAVDAAPGDGVCATVGGVCTLRAAVQEANTRAGADVITLSAGTYTLTIAGTGEFVAATGDLNVLDSLTINGAGAATTIVDGGALDGVFRVFGLLVSLTLNDLTVQNGSSAFQGGCIAAGQGLTLMRVRVQGCRTTLNGGGVSASGTLAFPSVLSITDTTIAQNVSTGFGGGLSLVGEGGLTTTISRSTISGNVAGTFGGGINASPGTTTMANSTISGNTATAGVGGGISFDGVAGSVMTLANVTINANSSGLLGDAVHVGGAGQFTARNTIVATVSGLNCAVTNGGVITDLGNNLEFPGATCGFTTADPLLAALASNGGFTQTHALASGSPAVDAGAAATCAAAPVSGVDQRGITRPFGASCDIGAFELVAAPTVTAIAPSSGPTAGGTNVTITGTNFRAGATVTSGGVAATSAVVVNATTITATTGAHAAGTVDVVVTTPGAPSGTLGNGFTYAVNNPPPPVNNAPTITTIAGRTTDEDTATSAIPFTLGDVETAAASLTVSGSSSNTTLVPNANIAFGGSGASRTVTVTPASSQSGTATITVTVSDGMASTSTAFVLTVLSKPTVLVDRASLNFAATSSGTAFTSQTGAQTVRLNQIGAGTVTWTAVSSAPWLIVSPTSGSGSAALTISTQFAAALAAAQTAGITLSFTGAANTAVPIGAALTVVTDPGLSLPFGVFETPVGDTTVLAGSIAVTGWALDNVGVQRLELWRDLQAGETTTPFASTPSDPRNGKVFIANATFVDNARPDVEAVYPTMPFKYRAGWGYLMLTWGLWNEGNGTYNLHAYAFDQENNLGMIGTKTIIVNNQAAARPFGAIDTPGSLGDASGPNFGWALTPKVNGAATCKIQPSGVQVSIDSGPLQPVVYGADVRLDVAGAFPGFSNSAAAGGHFIFDWSTLRNGTHTIGWLVTDDCNRADGVGSRFFNVSGGSSLTAAVTQAARSAVVEQETESSDSITVAHGFGQLPVILTPGEAGSRTVEVAQGDRIEIRLPRGFETAYELGPDGQRRALPTGATWDAATGTLSWQPAPGFMGRYRVVFTNGQQRIRVRIVVTP